MGLSISQNWSVIKACSSFVCFLVPHSQAPYLDCWPLSWVWLDHVRQFKLPLQCWSPITHPTDMNQWVQLTGSLGIKRFRLSMFEVFSLSGLAKAGTKAKNAYNARRLTETLSMEPNKLVTCGRVPLVYVRLSHVSLYPSRNNGSTCTFLSYSYTPRFGPARILSSLSNDWIFLADHLLV